MEPDTEAKRLLAEVIRHKGVKSLKAEEALLAMGEEGIDAILKHGDGFLNRHLFRVAVPFNLSQALIGFGGSAGLVFLIGRLLHFSDLVMLLLMLPAVVIGFLLNAVYIGPWLLFPPSERRFFRLVAKVNDVRMIPILLSGHTAALRGHEMCTSEALTRLLPQLSDGTNMTISSERRTSLHNLARGGTLKRRVPTELMCAALHALPILGDASSITVVQSLVERASPVWVLSPKEDEAARRCLEALNAKFGGTKGSDTLLRPSQQSPLTASQELLRPANEKTPHDPDQMLRPSEQDNPTANLL